MKPVAVLAVGGESALGSGRAAHHTGEVGEVPATAISEDAVLAASGLKKPFVARAHLPPDTEADPAAELLARAARSLAAELDSALPDWRTKTLGVVIGSSSGGMDPLIRALALRSAGAPVPCELARRSTYFGPLGALDSVFGGARERVQVLAACASSAIALGLGCRWLEAQLVDLVIAGGYDAVTPFVAAGFESLGATSADRPRPFRVGRDGMALGEAAVLFALARREDVREKAMGFVRGFGASSDAAHVTAPDRNGIGLTRAARAALSDAALDPRAVGLVSAHATATPFNDAAEARALGAIFGGALSDVVLHPFKAVVGHTLGASAGLELAAALDSMIRGVLPAAVGHGAIDSDLPLRLLSVNDSGRAQTCLKLSAAFGGANASLVVSTVDGEGRAGTTSGIDVIARGEPATEFDPEHLARSAQIPSVHLARLDLLSGLAVAAAHDAVARAPELPKERTGVVIGTAAATLENNEIFDRRRRERGPRGVEPRRFPATSPNLVAGQVSIAFGLLGPSLSVGAGLSASLEALLAAYDLLAAGDADAMLVIAAEDARETVHAFWEAAGWPIPAHGAVAAVLCRSTLGTLDRSRLSAARQAADSALGSLGSAQPGWPAFLAALQQFESPP